MSNTENNYSDLLQDKLLMIKINKLDQDFLSFKSAYPNYSDGMIVPGEHNLDKWVKTLKDIYFKSNQGMNWKQSFDSSTEGWNTLEKIDFNQWVNFYQEQGHLKYKKAQMSWYTPPQDENEVDDLPIGQVPKYSGYFAPNGHDDNRNLHSDTNAAKDSSEDDISPAERKKLIDKHKKKLISRLDSVEKLLRSDEGHLLTESEYDSLLEAIYSLKKKISSLKKKTSGDLFYKDLIVRQANILAKVGFYKAASFLYVVADNKATVPGQSPPASPLPAPSAPAENLPAESQPAAPLPASPPGSTSTPASGDLSTPKNDVQVPPTASNAPSPISSGGLTGNLPGDTTENNSPLSEISDQLGEGFDVSLADDDGLVVHDDESFADDLDEYLIAEAQMADNIVPPTPFPSTPPVNSKIEAPAAITVTEKDFDDRLNNALSNIKIEDVVKKIEDLSKIFKTREIPRQLAIVDMMLDHLGIATFFPSLSEATNKALESNNYILTRIEAILTQLSGAIKTDEINLTREESVTPPQAESIKANLQQKSDLEKERKEMRKELADKALEERVKEDTPELEVTEDEIAPPVLETPSTPLPAPLPPPSPAAGRPV